MRHGKPLVDRYPVHHSFESMIVIDWIVLRTSVVPHGHRSHSPLEATSKFRLCLVGKKIIKQRPAFGFCHIFKTDRVAIVDEQRLSVSFWVNTHSWVFSF